MVERLLMSEEAFLSLPSPHAKPLLKGDPVCIGGAAFMLIKWGDSASRVLEGLSRLAAAKNMELAKWTVADGAPSLATPFGKAFCYARYGTDRNHVL